MWSSIALRASASLPADRGLAQQGIPIDVQGARVVRITSYNVCYTKLLRHLVELLAREGLALGGALHLDQAPVGRVTPTWYLPSTRVKLACCTVTGTAGATCS